MNTSEAKIHSSKNNISFFPNLQIEPLALILCGFLDFYRLTARTKMEGQHVKTVMSDGLMIFLKNIVFQCI